MKVKFESTMHRQRFVLGLICGLLPICCVLFGLFGASVNLPGWWHSISATYYATSSPWMVGSLCLASFFFLTYRGYDLGDRWFTNLSALTSICIVVFPCSNSFYDKVGIFQLPSNVSGMLHNITAAMLFVSFGLMILCQFTKGTNKKKNVLYRVCAIVIFASVLGIGLATLLGLPGYMTIVCEFVLLEAFAVAWIVKSNVSIDRPIEIDCDGRCLNCEYYDTSDCPDRR